MNNLRRRRSQPPRPGRHLVLLLALCLFGVAAITAAQGPEPTATPEPVDEPPPRNVEREAPPREPVVLHREVLDNNAVNAIIAIPAAADTYVASGHPSENFGSDALFLGFNNVGDAYGAQRILAVFDVNGAIPDGAIINDATLRLRLTFSSPADDAPMETALRRVTSPWDEFTANWNNRPAVAEVHAVTDIGSVPTWYDFQVTDLVAGWSDGSFPNHGVEIAGDETPQERERAFYARETATEFFPQLVVDFTDSGDTEPPIVTVDPLPAFSARSFTVSWSGDDQGSAGIAHYDVQYRVDGGDWVDWQFGVTFTSAEFSSGEDGRLYEFRARGVDNAGNVEPFGAVEASTTVDGRPPVSTVEPLPPLTNSDTFTVEWSGQDAASGIAYFDVQYRFNDGPWTLWLPQTIATSAVFTSMGDGLYQFEVRAADNFGRVEPFADVPEASILVDLEPPFVEPMLYLAAVFGD